MSNEDIVRKFFSCYQAHDFKGMHSCLDENVKFSDFAFNLHGKEVKAMWHWFCISYPPREKPIDMPEYEILSDDSNTVTAKYRVVYLNGEQQRPVDYFIQSQFVVQNEKIVKQEDTFKSISKVEFAYMAFGFPKQLGFLIPIFHVFVKKKAAQKLKQFMQEHGYFEIS